MLRSIICLLLFSAPNLSLMAQDKPVPEKPKEEPKKADAVPQKDVTTEGLVTINGKKIPYKATTGKLVLNKEDGSPRASIFHVSYVRSDQDSANRPVTFAFNGGPGSSAVWLHLGALGPRIIQMPGDGTLPAKRSAPTTRPARPSSVHWRWSLQRRPPQSVCCWHIYLVGRGGGAASSAARRSSGSSPA